MTPGVCVIPVQMKRSRLARLVTAPMFRPCGQPTAFRVTLHGEARDLCREHARQYQEDLPWTDLATNPAMLKIEEL